MDKFAEQLNKKCLSNKLDDGWFKLTNRLSDIISHGILTTIGFSKSYFAKQIGVEWKNWSDGVSGVCIIILESREPKMITRNFSSRSIDN